MYKCTDLLILFQRGYTYGVKNLQTIAIARI